MQNVTDSNLKNFKRLLRRVIFLTQEEAEVFDKVPDETWKAIFAKNFDGNFNYAQRVLLRKFQEVEKNDTAAVDAQKLKIKGLKKSVDLFNSFQKQGKPIIFITDYDNDGSFAQTIIKESLEKAGIDGCIIEFAQHTNGNPSRGFNLDHLELVLEKNGISGDEEFLVITADNGINSRAEQKKIQERYPQVHLIVTDHHMPDPDMVVEENKKTVILNPKHKPTAFFSERNISGATTVGVLMQQILRGRGVNDPIFFEKLSTLFKASNMLDYVDTHPADKPEKDYVASKFLKLQPLLNTTNSLGKIITQGIPEDSLQKLGEVVEGLDVEVLREESKNILVQNAVAKVLLKMYETREQGKELVGDDGEVLQEGVPKSTAEDFRLGFLSEIHDTGNFVQKNVANHNYIDQLRPVIFSLAADQGKTGYMEGIEDKMLDVFQAIRLSESRILKELRKGDAVVRKKLEFSTISLGNEEVLKVFNRKLLNKAYNDENKGFMLTLDNVGKNRVSGSFRSLYDISDILKNKSTLEKRLGVKIETPGHERAAGFILSSSKEITSETIDEINQFINASITKLKKLENKQGASYILTNLSGLALIDKINHEIKGNISHFEKITPLIQVNRDTTWTDSYTTEQFSIEELLEEKKFGYVTINTNFDGGTTIIPVETLRAIHEGGYKDYLSLGYMDGGVFMVDRVVRKEAVANIIDIRTEGEKTRVLREAWEQDFKEKNIIELSREQLFDNPFFKYHDYGDLNKNLFEKMVVSIIDSTDVDTLAVFDVEANGFGISKLINIGATNYSIDQQSGSTMPAKDFNQKLYSSRSGVDYLIEDTQNLKPLSEKDLEDLHPAEVLEHRDEEGKTAYFSHPELKRKNGLLFEVKNYTYSRDGQNIIYNRDLKVDMLAYLVKDEDFKVPQEMTELTGITQELLNKYGKKTFVVDKELAQYYRGKKVLFGAHNTPYDARVSKANLPQFHKILTENKVYDSALFSKDKALAYDHTSMVKFDQVDKVRKNVLFYFDELSDFNIRSFLEKNEDGVFPDRTNNFLLEIEAGTVLLVDKVSHEKISLEASPQTLLEKMKVVDLPKNMRKFSVEKLSEQYMIHSLLLHGEKFNIQYIFPSGEYSNDLCLKNSDLIRFQQGYHFDVSPLENIERFMRSGFDSKVENIEALHEALAMFAQDFLRANKEIAQKFGEAWMYKSVLSIHDPKSVNDISNDVVDLIKFQTGLPEEKVREIMEKSVSFKKAYGVDRVLQHEMHANGPWRGDAKGDVMFEDKLSLTLLADKDYNGYQQSIDAAVASFRAYQLNAQLNFDISVDAETPAHDSYSFRQGLTYDRGRKSGVVSDIQNKEEDLQGGMREIVKFKLDHDVLPDKSCIYAIKHKNIDLNREDIERHKKMFGFILLNSQIISSVQNSGSSEASAVLEKAFEANREKIMNYKQELSKYYSHVEFNRSEYEISAFLDDVVDIGVYGKMPKNQNLFMKKDILPSLDKEALTRVSQLAQKLIDSARQLGVASSSGSDLIHEVLQKRRKMGESRMDFAFQNETSINDFSKIREPNFLFNINIVRKEPVARFLGLNQDARILNSFIEERMSLAADLLNKKRKGFSPA